ncbi:hypothetical protein F2Q69_00001986 [Brassica cretica]|uniref:PPM-type phosphatase domain-containing protein n=1 Tax=Brassica cretica TaxID=69181 RepID=A0A8S9PDR6_BRACR|nr:hypothetical protein F2Q69_00001986 [Brassica cretica]
MEFTLFIAREEDADQWKTSTSRRLIPRKEYVKRLSSAFSTATAEFAAKNLGSNIEAAMAAARSGEEGYSTERAIRDGYIKTDEDFLKEGSRGGACCVTALISEGELAVSNAGDCRAVISRGGVAEALTTHHNPGQADELKRIEALVTNQEAVDVVRPYCVDVENPKTLSACQKLVELSCKRGSLDDISLIIIQLQKFVP